MKRLYIFKIFVLFIINSNGQVTTFSSNNVGVGATVDSGYKFEVFKTGTSLTSIQRLSKFHNTGTTFNTTSGALSSYAGHFLSTATRVAGSNDLTNIGLYAAASGADYNYAAVFPTGQVGIGSVAPYYRGGNLVVNGGVAPVGSTPAIPVMTINASTANTDALHIRYGATQGYEGYLSLRISANGSAAFGAGMSSGADLSNIATSRFAAHSPIYIAYLLEGAVGQTANIMQVRDNASNQATFLSVKADGKIGVGTNTPSSKFQVNGTVRVDCSYEYGSGLLLTTENNGYYVNGSLTPNTLGGMDIVSGASTLSFSSTGIKAYGNLTAANKVMIGAVDPALVGTHSLAVNGSGLFTKVVVRNYNNWPDYVFDKGYQLRSLSSLENFINDNKHLPDVPSAAEIDKNGVDLSEVQAALLRKVEELTLYVIEQNKKIERQGKQIEELQTAKKKN